ncbi:MAG: hypothetical protein HYR62_01170 [Actinobacteria bacterium]|nr:hypothetical protein [Actinomycetota bacterium]MBI3688786.1 hypothetical protein [Actinomycetota bacterium]
MSLTDRETWGLIHGMVLGAAFLLAFGGGVAGFWSLKPELVTAAGVVERIRRLKVGVVAMAVAAWGTVLTGTWVVYPWYRSPAKTSPKSILVADESTAQWHEFGMEWKEHIAWLSPILATVVAFVVVYLGTQLIRHDNVRRMLLTLFVIAFGIAAVAGLFGALITKVAPVL